MTDRDGRSGCDRTHLWVGAHDDADVLANQHIHMLTGYLMAAIPLRDGCAALGVAITALYNDRGLLRVKCVNQAVGEFYEPTIRTAWERIAGSDRVQLDDPYGRPFSKEKYSSQ